MELFWLIAGLLILAAVGLLIAPLLRPPQAGADENAHALEVHKDALAELARDEARGSLAAAEAQSIRTELSRRLLKAADLSARPASPLGRRGLMAVITLVAVLLPLLAMGLYTRLGLPAQMARISGNMERAEESQAAAADAEASARADPEIVKLVEELGRKMQGRPDDLQGWTLYARSLSGIGRPADAAEAFRKALALAPGNDPKLVGDFGEALVAAARWTVTAEARRAFHDVLTLDPKDARARYYLALEKEQTGDVKAALADYQALARDSKPADGHLELVRSRIATLAVRAGTSPDDALAGLPVPQTAPPLTLEDGKGDATAPATPPGPSQADMQAAASMSADDRKNMIVGMVARLEDKLKANPDDGDGWSRLGRAYLVLGRTADAVKAYSEAVQRLPGDQTALSGLLTAQDTADGTSGPTAATRATAQNLLKLDPNAPRALWLEGLARAQAKDLAGAKDFWQRLLDGYPPGAPERADQIAAMAAALKEAGLDPVKAGLK